MRLKVGDIVSEGFEGKRRYGRVVAVYHGRKPAIGEGVELCSVVWEVLDENRLQMALTKEDISAQRNSQQDNQHGTSSAIV